MIRVTPASSIHPVQPTGAPAASSGRSQASAALAVVGAIILFTPIEETAAALLLWKVANGRRRSRRR